MIWTKRRKLAKISVLGLTSFDRVTLKDILASRVEMNVIRLISISVNSLVSKVRSAFVAPALAPAFA